MSDRRVLAVSAACITAAIFLFLLGTFPSWKTAIGDGAWWHRDAPLDAEPMAPPPAPAGRSGIETHAVARTQDIASDDATVASRQSASARAVAAMPAPATGLADLHPQPAAPAGTAAATSAEGSPSFDIVRVEPSGDSVIAARAHAGATVTLLDQGRPIAQAQADGSGQVAFVPPALAPGEHSLMLSVGGAGPSAPSGALSSQSVAVSVPPQAKSAPMVALLQPDAPTRLLSVPAAPAPAGTPSPAPSVSVGAVDVEEMGSVFATGHAAPGSQCHVYLNGSFVANVTAGKDGTWSLKIEHGMRPGHYSVRVDQLASAAGDVAARAEVPFDYPARAAASVSLLRPRKGTAALAVAPGPPPAPPAAAGGRSPPLPSGTGAAASASVTGQTAAPATGPQVAAASSASPDLAASPASGVPAVVAQLLTTKVIHGDSLWRISRKMLGHGRRYTQIYAANTTQIRDPRLIYPGQIFVMPQGAE